MYVFNIVYTIFHKLCRAYASRLVKYMYIIVDGNLIVHLKKKKKKKKKNICSDDINALKIMSL